jgi:hypothetical protein
VTVGPGPRWTFHETGYIKPRITYFRVAYEQIVIHLAGANDFRINRFVSDDDGQCIPLRLVYPDGP